MEENLEKNALSMTPEEFRRLGHRVVDWIADYRTRAATSPVAPETSPGALLRRLPDAPPEQPEGFDAVLADMLVV